MLSVLTSHLPFAKPFPFSLIPQSNTAFSELLNANFTPILFKGLHKTNLNSSKPPLQSTFYIPNSQTAITVLRKPRIPITQADFELCLKGVVAFAHQEDPHKLLHNSFWDPFESNAGFKITPTVYSHELNWEDVIMICGALMKYFARLNTWQAIDFFVEDVERGALGSGGIERLEPDVEGLAMRKGRVETG